MVHGRWAEVTVLVLSIINKLNFYNWLVIAAMLGLGNERFIICMPIRSICNKYACS